MTKLSNRLLALMLTESALLLSTARKRKGTVKTASMLVSTNSISARAVFPPAWATSVCPCASVDGPTANAVSPVHRGSTLQHSTALPDRHSQVKELAEVHKSCHGATSLAHLFRGLTNDKF